MAEDNRRNMPGGAPGKATAAGVPEAAMPDYGGAARLKKRGADGTVMTLSISQEDKAKVKAWAAKHGMSVSDLLHRWIEERCAD